MKKTVLFVVCAVSLLALVACDMIIVPKTVTIDGVTYRNGFYGDLWPINLTYKSDYIINGSYKFRLVNCEQFDLVHSAIGSTTNGVVYCAESQWEEAYAYYADSANFAYYCRIGNKFDDNNSVTATIPNIDPIKFDELMAFAEENCYIPFGSNKNVETIRLPMPDIKEFPEHTFYKECNDGLFTSYKGYTFHIINDKLLLLFYYEYGNDELFAVEVADELGQYFIELLTQFSVQ